MSERFRAGFSTGSWIKEDLKGRRERIAEAEVTCTGRTGSNRKLLNREKEEGIHRDVKWSKIESYVSRRAAAANKRQFLKQE